MNARFWLGLGMVALAAAFTGCADDSPGSEAGGGSGSAGVPAAGGENAGSAGRPLPEEGGSGGQSGSELPEAGSGGEGGERVSGPKTILIVLEGLRPELVSAELTPNLWRIAESGVRFSNFGSVLPSNRMAAAGSLATGTVPARHGVLGERIYAPGVSASDAQGRSIDTSQPFDIEDQGTLESLRAAPGGFLHAKTLVEVAQAAGFRTAVIGRAGPASLFDIERRGQVLNDNYVWPRSLANQVSSLPLGMPNDASALFPDLSSPSAYRPAVEADYYGAVANFQQSLPPTSATPVLVAPLVVFLNPTLPLLHTYDNARKLELAIASLVLREDQSDLLVLWLRDAGETSLRSAPGSLAARNQVASLDRALLGLDNAIPEGSNLIIVSDGGTSALAGDARFFPHWGVAKDQRSATNWVSVEVPGGVTTDGAVRLTDLLARAGFLAYDGQPCLSGLAFTSYPTFRNEPTWPATCSATIIGTSGQQTGPALVPSSLDPRAVIVASNGASELLYVPSHLASEVTQLVSFLQSRPEVGAIFLAPRYGKLPGTLDLGSLGFAAGSDLDLLVTYAWDSADPVGYGPQVDSGQLVTPGLAAGCGLETPCRPGLYCDISALQPTCKFCPTGEARSYSACNVGEPAFEQAQVESVYQTEAQFCEDSRVCAPGLVCRTSVCREAGAKPAALLSEPPLGFAPGSSYGAMAGISAASTIATVAAKLITDYHGVRGGSSPTDLRGILIARGPAFKSHVVVDLPSGIVDVAPTLLHALEPGLELQLGEIDGRVLDEALADSTKQASSTAFSETSEPANVPFYSPTKPDSTPKSLLRAQGTYSSELTGFTVTRAGKQYRYWTQAVATRDSLTCNTSDDCPAGTDCGVKHVCTVTPTCVDGVKNGLETDVDCGFEAKCFKCDSGKACGKNADCESACLDSVCQ